MRDPSLVILLDEVRGKTLRALQDVPDEQVRRPPPGLNNHILWHAGHSYVVVECLTMQSIDAAPQLPAGWFEMFSWESRPSRVPPDHWPPLAQVVAQLEQQHERLRALFANLDGDHLDQPTPGRPGRTVRTTIIHALHDEACHCGEVLLLRKLHSVRTT